MRWIAALLLLICPACAEDNGHSLHHNGFYEHLKQPGTGISCCNNSDCRPISWSLGYDGAVSMKIGGRWIKMPPNRVMELTTPDGGAHWCGITGRNGETVTYCAVIPKGAS